MTRSTTRFVCQTCAAEHLRWEGQCRSCGAWSTLVETVIRAGPAKASAAARSGPASAPSEPEWLGAVVERPLHRRLTGVRELDRVLGGGIVPGSLVLVAGEPGVGKSTLVLQAAAGLAAPGRHVLYATGEESAAQVALRARRLGPVADDERQPIAVIAEHDVGRIAQLVEASAPGTLVVDSIQTATVDELDGPAGSVGQVRESALRLLDLAKRKGTAVILVGHVTKDGAIAGPRTLEHLVDAVLSLEGERSSGLRLIRATKNRFGSTEEVGVLEMGEAGLRELRDPARAFLGTADPPAPGSVVAPTLEGTRPLLVEVQALVAPGGYGPPRRAVTGLDPNRVALIIAVLGRRAGVSLGTNDVYASLAGGLQLGEPALDLALAVALASSARDRPVLPSTVIVGEVGLLGEVRPIAGLERRLREAARLGFRRAIVPGPAEAAPAASIAGLEVIASPTVREALEASLGPAPQPSRRNASAGRHLARSRGEAPEAMLG